MRKQSFTWLSTFVVILLLNPSDIIGQVLEQDSLALVALYDSTDGTNWTNKDNWLTGPVADWYGIDVENERVTSIKLHGNNLTGTLPSEIGDLDTLTYLDLSLNQLSGPIPEEIGNLIYLNNLYLNCNQFGDSIPAGIQNLTRLSHLELRDNQISGTIPLWIGDIVNLITLILSENQLTGSIPPEIGNLDQCKDIYLNSNQLTGQIPQEIGNLSNLMVLDLSYNQLNSPIPPEIGNLDDLIYCYFYNNQFSGPIPPEIGDLVSIQTLDLSYNQFEGTIPADIGNLTTLLSLYLNDNQLEGPIPPEIGDLTNLSYLNISLNQLSDSIPAEIGKLAQLASLYLAHNQFSGAIPEEMGFLPNMMFLDLGNNQLTGAVPGTFTNLEKLTSFYVDYNQLDELPDLSSLPDLSYFSVYNNRFTFEDLEPNIMISNFDYTPQNSVGTEKDTTVTYGTSLSFLVSVGGASNQYQWFNGYSMIPGATSDEYTIGYVSSADAGDYICRVTNTVVPGLTIYSRPIHVTVVGANPEFEQDSLALVALYNSTDGAHWTNNDNWLSGSVLTWYGITVSDDRISRIVLAFNNLDGIIPPEIGDLTELTSLDLDNNQLGDTIPAEIGNLIQLTSLYLNNNQLTGSIPPAIGNLTSLTHLILDNNALDGSIPEEIGNLIEVKQCYLDGNELTGSIPSEMGNLIKATYINLTDNQLAGAVPDAFTNLIALKTLRINYNQLDGLPNLSLLPELHTLYAQDNRFTFEDIEPNITIPAFFYAPQDSVGEAQDTTIDYGASFPLIVDVGGVNNQYQWLHDQTILSGAVSDTYTINFATIEDEGSYVCQITNSVATELTLYSHTTTITVKIPGNIEQDSLALVTLYDSTDGTNWTNHTNWLAGSLDTWFGITVEDERVKIVDLDNNNLNGTVPPEIENLTAVTYLYLSDNQLVGEIPPEIGNLASVEYLYMGNNQFTGSIPPEIGKLPNLSDFYLDRNELNGPIPPEIGNCTNLVGLYLNNNQLSDSIPPEICNLTELYFLYLDGNQLTGEIPQEIGNLSKLRILRLANNQLSGSIPSEIGDLSQLYQLELFYNQFTGPVPEEISQCTALQFCYIHQNHLEGSIPSQFTDLTILQRFYINSNQFTGLPDLSSIPTLTDLTAEDNRLTFEDIEPNIRIPNFSYWPQDSVGEKQDTTIDVGSSIILSVEVGGTANVYQWFKNGEEVTDADSLAYVIESATESDSGSYVCQITNTIVTDLTLYSRPIGVHISEGVGVVDQRSGIPEEYALLQNYPNPFNPETRIEYHLPQPSEVKLVIYDIKGQVVREFVQEMKPAGYHHVIWDGRNGSGQKVATGIYIYRIEIKSREEKEKRFVDVKKMVLMK